MQNKIRDLREGKHLKPKVFAGRLDIDISTLNRIENSKIGSFKPELLFKVADELGVTIDKLFGHEAPVAIQSTESGSNINVLNQTNESEDTKPTEEELIKTLQKANENTKQLYEQIIKAQQETIESLKREVRRLGGDA